MPTPLRVLFVCTANICRSPYMELRARSLQSAVVATPVRIEFASAGTHGFHSHPVDQAMAEVLAGRHVPATVIDGFSSRSLSRDQVESANLVLTAAAGHRNFVLDESPEAFRKVFTLGQFADSFDRISEDLVGSDLVSAVGSRRAGATPEHDIADPFNRGPAAAEQCADQIDRLLRVALPRLTGSERIAP